MQTIAENLVLLGHRIRQVRNASHQTQEHLSRSINVTNRQITRWETGQHAPSPEYLRKIAELYSIPYIEELYWLGLAGYIFPTPMPNAHQLTGLQHYFDNLTDYPYAAYLIDYRNNYLAVNSETVGFMRDYSQTIELLKKPANTVGLAFDTRIPAISMLKNSEEIQRVQLRRFLIKNLQKQHESFFRKFPTLFQREGQYELLQADYERFQRMWKEEYIDKFVTIRNIESLNDMTFHTLLGSMFFEVEPNRMITFNLIAEPIYSYFGLFEIIKFFPVSDEDRLLADAFFAPHRNYNEKNLQIWNHIGFDGLVERYKD